MKGDAIGELGYRHPRLSLHAQSGVGRVLQKLGMVYEGTMRQHVRNWDESLDLSFYGLLRHEWLQRQ